MQYDPLLPTVQENPYPYYSYMRRHAPVYWIESLQAWAVSRYADVDAATRDPKTFSSSGFIATIFGDLNPVPEVSWMLDLDPPKHTRLRKLVNKAFTRRLIAGMESRVRQIARGLTVDICCKAEFDLVSELSTPLPVIVIAELLGIEPERREDFKRWSNDVGESANRPTDQAERARIRGSVQEMRTYLQAIIGRRRLEPREDLVSALVQAEEDSQILSADEIFALCALLLLAGNETTTNLIGNAVLVLLDNQDLLGRLREETALIQPFIEEVLRFESPIQNTLRQTTCDIEIAGTLVPNRARVLLLNASANRDEDHFRSPDRFDLTRKPNNHLSFGYGIHYCLGAELARLEAKVALETLLLECPAFERKTAEVARIKVLNLRGPQNLPLAFLS